MKVHLAGAGIPLGFNGACPKIVCFPSPIVISLERGRSLEVLALEGVQDAAKNPEASKALGSGAANSSGDKEGGDRLPGDGKAGGEGDA
jgi:hypothetical protein